MTLFDSKLSLFAIKEILFGFLGQKPPITSLILAEKMMQPLI